MIIIRVPIIIGDIHPNIIDIIDIIIDHTSEDTIRGPIIALEALI